MEAPTTFCHQNLARFENIYMITPWSNRPRTLSSLSDACWFVVPPLELETEGMHTLAGRREADVPQGLLLGYPADSTPVAVKAIVAVKRALSHHLTLPQQLRPSPGEQEDSFLLYSPSWLFELPVAMPPFIISTTTMYVFPQIDITDRS